MKTPNAKPGAIVHLTDPNRPELKALDAIYELLTNDPPWAPQTAFEIALSAAGEILATCFHGDIDAECAQAPEFLKAVVERFRANNAVVLVARAPAEGRT